MKKALFSLIFSVITFVSAQAIQVTGYPVIQDSVQSYSVNLFQTVNGYVGNYQHHYLYALAGDTIFIDGPILSTNDGTLWRELFGLQPSTSYKIMAVVEKNGQQPDTCVWLVTTKPAPAAPEPIQITNIMVNPTLGHADVSFHYKIVGGYSVAAEALYQSYQYNSNSMILTGEGDATLVISSSYVSGTNYANNYLHFETVGTIPDVPTDTFIPYQNFTAPQPGSADITTLSLIANSPDSMIATATVVVGNTGSALIDAEFLNGNGTVVIPYTPFAITHDTTMKWGIGSLTNATYYGFRVRAHTIGGSDTAQTVPTMTQQVLYGSISSSWYLTNVTTGSADVNVTFDPNGNYPASQNGYAWIHYMDKFGNNVMSDTLFNIDNPISHPFHLQNLRPGPDANPAVIYYVNGAGLVSFLQVSIVVATPLINGNPSFNDLTANNSYTLTMSGIFVDVKSGNTSNILAKVQDLSHGGTESFLVSAGVTGTIGLVDFSINNRLGGTSYAVTIIDSNWNGTVVYGNTLYQSTPAAGLPHMSDITAGLITATTIENIYWGHCEGNAGTLTKKLFKNNNQVGAPLTSNAGSGPVQLNHIWTGLDPNTEYVSSGELSASGTSAAQMQKAFWTETTTGIQNVPANASKQLVRVYLFRLLDMVPVATGEFRTVASQFSGDNNLYIVVPIDEKGREVGTGRLHVFI